MPNTIQIFDIPAVEDDDELVSRLNCNCRKFNSVVKAGDARSVAENHIRDAHDQGKVWYRGVKSYVRAR